MSRCLRDSKAKCSTSSRASDIVLERRTMPAICINKPLWVGLYLFVVLEMKFRGETRQEEVVSRADMRAGV